MSLTCRLCGTDVSMWKEYDSTEPMVAATDHFSAEHPELITAVVVGSYEDREAQLDLPEGETAGAIVGLLEGLSGRGYLEE